MTLEVLHRPPTRPRGTTRPPLLLVHGAWHGAWCWDEHLMPFFADAGYDCHAVSLRGHAGSAGRDRLNSHRLRHYVEDVAAVAARLDAPPVVIGHSMGGGVAQLLLARRDRPRLAGAALLASMPPHGVRNVTGRIARSTPGRFLKLNATRDLGLLIETREDVRHLFFSDSLPDADVDRFHAQMQAESYLAFLDMLVLDRPRPREVSVPVFVLAASDDSIFSLDECRRTATAWGAESVVIDRLAHDVMLDTRWEAAADALLHWLDATV